MTVGRSVPVSHSDPLSTDLCASDLLPRSNNRSLTQKIDRPAHSVLFVFCFVSYTWKFLLIRTTETEFRMTRTPYSVKWQVNCQITVRCYTGDAELVNQIKWYFSGIILQRLSWKNYQIQRFGSNSPDRSVFFSLTLSPPLCAQNSHFKHWLSHLYRSHLLTELAYCSPSKSVTNGCSNTMRWSSPNRWRPVRQSSDQIITVLPSVDVPVRAR